MPHHQERRFPPGNAVAIDGLLSHAIHSFQAFDIGDIDFADPVEAMNYEHHIEFPYPDACHHQLRVLPRPGHYKMPDQTKSLPGPARRHPIVNETIDRAIGAIPPMSPGRARACGGCHRARVINEDNAGGLRHPEQHIKQGGYLVEAGEVPADTLNTMITEIMALFK